MTDPSLIIYHPVRRIADEDGVTTIVTNGDQTDTLRDFMLEGELCGGPSIPGSLSPTAPTTHPGFPGILFAPPRGGGGPEVPPWGSGRAPSLPFAATLAGGHHGNPGPVHPGHLGEPERGQQGFAVYGLCQPGDWRDGKPDCKPALRAVICQNWDDRKGRIFDCLALTILVIVPTLLQFVCKIGSICLEKWKVHR